MCIVLPFSWTIKSSHFLLPDIEKCAFTISFPYYLSWWSNWLWPYVILPCKRALPQLPWRKATCKLPEMPFSIASVLKWKYKAVYGFVPFTSVGGVSTSLRGIIGVALKPLNGVLNAPLGVNCRGLGALDASKLGLGGAANSPLDGRTAGALGRRRAGPPGRGYWNLAACPGNLPLPRYSILINWFSTVMRTSQQPWVKANLGLTLLPGLINSIFVVHIFECIHSACILVLCNIWVFLLFFLSKNQVRNYHVFIKENRRQHYYR